MKTYDFDNKVYYRGGTPIFIEVITNMSKDDLEDILKKIKDENIDKWNFEVPETARKNGKYNWAIPKNLLTKQFVEDCLDVDGMKKEL